MRLPYGARTGVDKVDKLTIIAHDRFQAIVDAANAPDSIIRKENIIEIDPEMLPAQQEVVVVSSVIDDDIARMYALIPHTAVAPNMSFRSLSEQRG